MQNAAKRAERSLERHEEALFESQHVTDRYLAWALHSDRVDQTGAMALAVLVHMGQRLDWSRSMVIKRLEMLAGALTRTSLRGDIIALAWNTLLALAESVEPKRLRAVFVRLRLPLDNRLLDAEAFPLFPRATDLSPLEAWDLIRDVRCIEEVVLEFADCLRSPTSEGLVALAASPLAELNPNTWPDLKLALTSERARAAIQYGRRLQEVCPRCHMVLSGTEKNDFRRTMTATAKNCGHGVIIFGGDR